MSEGTDTLVGETTLSPAAEVQKNVYELIADRLKDGFGVDDLEWAAKELVILAEDQLPTAPGQTKLDWVKANLIRLVESVDQLVPVVGLWLDNPLADAAEAQGIAKVVDWALTPVVDWAHTVANKIPQAKALFGGAE